MNEKQYNHSIILNFLLVRRKVLVPSYINSEKNSSRKRASKKYSKFDIVKEVAQSVRVDGKKRGERDVEDGV